MAGYAPSYAPTSFSCDAAAGGTARGWRGGRGLRTPQRRHIGCPPVATVVAAHGDHSMVAVTSPSLCIQLLLLGGRVYGATAAAAAAAAPLLYDDFSTYNTSLWTYADGSMGTTDKCKVWYLKNHSSVGAALSLGEGTGLRMLMSSTPCKASPATCHGAKMAADHVGSNSNHLYGDYELRMRAPYAVNGASGQITS
jgi:hypothetical protein